MKLSKKNQLWNFLKQYKFVRTSDIMQWGIRNYTNSPDRYARRLAEEGKLIRLTPSQKISAGFNTREGVYQVIRETQPCFV